MPKGGQPPPEGWEEIFFGVLQATQMVTKAAKAAGISLRYAYKHRKEDLEFAERWAEIKEHDTETLERIATKRAARGSDQLMMFILKARRPDVYRENVHHEHEHSHVLDGTVTLLDGRQPIQVDAAKRREAARMLLAGEAEAIEGTATDLPAAVEA